MYTHPPYLRNNTGTSKKLFLKRALWNCFVLVQLASFVSASPPAARSLISRFFWIGAGGFCLPLLPVLYYH